jgi:sucrose phosphorylase
LDEIGQEIERPVVKDLFRLLAFRNTAKAFDGDLEITKINEGAFTLTWATAKEAASLTVDLPTNKFSILHRTEAGEKQIF